MGRRCKTEAEIRVESRVEKFGPLYAVGKAKLGLCEDQIAGTIGLCRPALLERRKNPGKITLEEIGILGDLFGWSDDVYLSLIHPRRGR